MKFDPLNLRPLRTGLVVVTSLAAAGWALDPLEQPAWDAIRAKEPALKLDTVQGALGQGLTVGLLGGFRALAADFLWVKGEVLQEDEDLPGAQSCFTLVTTIDPRPLFFWTNSSRIIAYDMTRWRIDSEGGYEKVTPRRQQAIGLEQATVALKLLQDALTYHPKSTVLYRTAADIHFERTKNFGAAASLYQLAAQEPGGSGESGYAARQCARMLERLGRNQQAYEWLKQRYAGMPKPPGTPGSKAPATDHPLTIQEQIDAGEAEDMMNMIREVEKKLALPSDRTFQP